MCLLIKSLTKIPLRGPQGACGTAAAWRHRRRLAAPPPLGAARHLRRLASAFFLFTQTHTAHLLGAKPGEEAGPLQLRGSVQFDRTRHVRSTPWCLSGAQVQLVDCTYPKLRDREGVVEGCGWEPKSCQVRVQVRAAGESVRVWPCEVGGENELKEIGRASCRERV